MACYTEAADPLHSTSAWMTCYTEVLTCYASPQHGRPTMLRWLTCYVTSSWISCYTKVLTCYAPPQHTWPTILMRLPFYVEIADLQWHFSMDGRLYSCSWSAIPSQYGWPAIWSSSPAIPPDILKCLLIPARYECIAETFVACYGL